MRKITIEATEAFMQGHSMHKGNTKVTDGVKNDGPVDFEITNAGWYSNTTKERLNGLPGVNISQSKGVWYLNGSRWNGQWKEIINPNNIPF